MQAELELNKLHLDQESNPNFHATLTPAMDKLMFKFLECEIEILAGDRSLNSNGHFEWKIHLNSTQVQLVSQFITGINFKVHTINNN